MITATARKYASAGTEIIGICSPNGAKNIDSYYGDYMSAPHMIEAVRRTVAREHFDAVVLCGFGNVGIYALKEVLDIPVVSISEASMALACLLGHRFSTLTMLRQFVPYQQDLVRLWGFEAKCASVRAININVEDAVIKREQTLQELSEQVKKIVREDQADVIILACAGLCGYDDQLSDLAGIPVIDPVVAGVKIAESLVGMKKGHSKLRKFHAPPQRLEDYEGDVLAPSFPAGSQ